MRRVEIEMSRQILGEHIGLTFQQIQQYEKGMNRIGASRLQQIARFLEVPVSYFSRAHRAAVTKASKRSQGAFWNSSARVTGNPD
jgi:transcriptional regulator with XRE-family HTH domain